MTVVYSFNDGYAMQAGVSLLSLLFNNITIENINIVIVDDDISSENKLKLNQIASTYKREIRFIALEKVLTKLDVQTSFYRCAYARLFLADCLEDDVAYYFDSDTIINNSIDELANIDMSIYYVAGVQDTVNPAYLTGIGLNCDEKYINDGGVIILNLRQWRENNLEEKCLSFIKSHNGSPPHNDQGTINFVCQGKKLILRPEYNLMNPVFVFCTKQLCRLFKMKSYYSQADIDSAKGNPIIIHYTEELFNRPWFANCRHPLKNIFIKYLNMSPWSSYVAPTKKLSKNAAIQRFVYQYSPFVIYLLMIRLIEFRHSVRKLLGNKYAKI